jgi:hypothetical protein
MGMITVEARDVTGNKRELVWVPDDEPVNRVLVKLAEAMNLPLKHPDGQLMSYKFHHATVGQLRDEQTLGAAGVKNGDLVRLYPELIAGGR